MAAHHPGQLAEPLVAVDGTQPGGRHRAVVALEDDEVAVAVRSHLREMGHDDDLGEARKTCQPAADLERHRATDAGVDLVEHERLPASRVGEYDLERQPYPRQLTTRGHLRQRPRLRAGVGREQQADRIRAVRTGLWQRRHRELEPCVRQGEGGQLLAHGRRQLRRRRDPHRGDPLRGHRDALREGGDLGRQRLDAVIAGLELGQPRRARGGPVEHLSDGLAVLAGQSLELRPARGNPFESYGVGVEVGEVRRCGGRQVADQRRHLTRLRRQLGGLSVGVCSGLERLARLGHEAESARFVAARVLVAGQRHGRVVREESQVVDRLQTPGLSRERHVLVGLGRHRGDLLEAERQEVLLTGTLPRLLLESCQLGSRQLPGAVVGSVCGEFSGQLRTGRPVEDLALSFRRRQSLLLRLSMDGHEPGTDVRTDGCRYLRAAEQ